MMSNDMIIGIGLGLGGYLLWEKVIRPRMGVSTAGNGAGGWAGNGADGAGGFMTSAEAGTAEQPWSAAEQRELEHLLQQSDVVIEDEPTTPPELGPDPTA